MSDSSPQTFLLIDDNPNDRLLVKRELSKEFDRITVREVIDQKQFDIALSKANFDFAITDFQLGWTNGLKTLEAIRIAKPQCPVIMFTNTGTQEIAVEAMKSGLDDYVIKSPQHFVRLRQAVRSVWQQYQTQQKATDLEQRLQALLNQLDVGIFRADQSGQLLEANEALLNMLNVRSLLAAKAILSQPLSAVAHPNEASRTLEVSIQPSTEQNNTSGNTAKETAKGKTALWLKIIAAPNKVNSQEIIDGLVEDITARKQAEESLSQLNKTLEAQVQQRTQQLERINQELELFAYSVSHDLQAPIRQIDGFIELLRTAISQPDQQQIEDTQSTLTENQAKQTETQQSKIEHYFSVILGLTQQSTQMIDALLDFSRTGRAEIVYESVDMNQIVSRLRSLITDSHPTRTIHWQVEPLPVVKCDRALITIVWQNLIENAIKFTQSKEITRIEIGTITDSRKDSLAPIKLSEIVFFVEDNGIGFNPQQSERIFGMFQQAHPQTIAKGTGIGLANVKRIISRHRGRTWAEGEVGQGATVYFSLPVHTP